MTDNTPTLTPVRSARHSARQGLLAIVSAASHIDQHLQGRSGLTKEQQTENLQTALSEVEALESSLAVVRESLAAAVEIATTRDFEASQQAKEEAKAATLAQMAADAEAYANSPVAEDGVEVDTEDGDIE